MIQPIPCENHKCKHSKGKANYLLKSRDYIYRHGNHAYCSIKCKDIRLKELYFEDLNIYDLFIFKGINDKSTRQKISQFEYYLFKEPYVFVWSISPNVLNGGIRGYPVIKLTSMPVPRM